MTPPSENAMKRAANLMARFHVRTGWDRTFNDQPILEEMIAAAIDAAVEELKAENERLQLAYDLSVSRYAELHDGDSIL